MKNSKDPCHYDTLGVAEHATESEIKKAFRKKVRPRRSGNDKKKEKKNRSTKHRPKNVIRTRI